MSQPDDEQVRRLLADARHTEPMPDEVASRLDGLLADLRAETSTATAPPRTADLGAARRRRNARTWLVAAAAVVAVGIGINQVDLTSSSDDADGGSSATSAQDDRSDESYADGAGGDSDGARSPAPGANADGTAPRDEIGAGGAVPLDSDRFGAQVKRLGSSPDLASGALTLSTPKARDTRLAPGCRTDAASGRWGAGRVVAVSYDGAPGVLVFHPSRGETQVVDLFLCGQEQAERSITLPLG